MIGGCVNKFLIPKIFIIIKLINFRFFKLKALRKKCQPLGRFLILKKQILRKKSVAWNQPKILLEFQTNWTLDCHRSTLSRISVYMIKMKEHLLPTVPHRIRNHQRKRSKTLIKICQMQKWLK